MPGLNDGADRYLGWMTELIPGLNKMTELIPGMDDVADTWAK